MSRNTATIGDQNCHRNVKKHKCVLKMLDPIDRPKSVFKLDKSKKYKNYKNPATMRTENVEKYGHDRRHEPKPLRSKTPHGCHDRCRRSIGRNPSSNLRNLKNQKNRPKNRPPCGQEMSRNMAMIDDQNCHPGVPKHHRVLRMVVPIDKPKSVFKLEKS